MTSPEPLIPAPLVRTLPISIDGDLVVTFRNRNPDDPSSLADFPPGVVGVLTIYQDLKTTGGQRIIETGAPIGPVLAIKVPSAALNALRTGTLWGFRLAYPDEDFADGTYDKAIVVGEIVRVDGRAA